MSMIYEDIKLVSIIVTFEIKNTKRLPFLDVLIIRNCAKKLGIDVFRKDTQSHRYIPNTSHHRRQHKISGEKPLGSSNFKFPT